MGVLFHKSSKEYVIWRNYQKIKASNEETLSKID